MSINEVNELSERCSLNECIRTVNIAIRDWNGMCGPIDKNTNTALVCAKMDKTGASIQHVLKGTCVAYCAIPDCKPEDLCKDMEMINRSPWIACGGQLKKW